MGDGEETWPKPEKRGRRLVLAFLRMMLMYSASSYYIIISWEYYTGCLGRTILAHVFPSLHILYMWPKRMEIFRIILFPFWWEIGIMLLILVLFIFLSEHFSCLCNSVVMRLHFRFAIKDMGINFTGFKWAYIMVAHYCVMFCKPESVHTNIMCSAPGWKEDNRETKSFPKGIIISKRQPFLYRYLYPIQVKSFDKY